MIQYIYKCTTISWKKNQPNYATARRKALLGNVLYQLLDKGRKWDNIMGDTPEFSTKKKLQNIMLHDLYQFWSALSMEKHINA